MSTPELVEIIYLTGSLGGIVADLLGLVLWFCGHVSAHVREDSHILKIRMTVIC
jgi:hypothetical protein